MKSILPLLVLVGGAGIGAALAAPASHGGPESALGPEHPRPVDEAQERLHRLHKSKRARTLKKAYDALTGKKPAEALKLAQTVSRDDLFGDYALWIMSQAYEARAQKALEAKDYEGAEKLSGKAMSTSFAIDARDPYSPLLRTLPHDLGLAEITEANSLWARKKFSSAQEVFERGFQRLSTIGTFEEVRPDAFHHYADTCAKNRNDLCVSWIQRFIQLFPRGSQEARAIAKGFPESMDRPRSPKPVSKLVQTYRGPDLDLVAFDAAMGDYLAGKYKDSIQKLNQFLDEYPKSTYRYRARYWLSQAWNQEQDHDKAQKQYDDLAKDSPLTYYGLLASVANAKEFDSQISASLPLVAETDPFLLPQEVRRLKRAEAFIVEQAFELAAIELRDVRPRDALSNHFLMYLAVLAYEAQNYASTFSILSQLAQRGYEGMLTTFVTKMIFPTPYLDLIKKYAAAANLDPVLVLSLIKQESAFTPTAGSSVGAVGLMQLMPATAVDVDPDITRADLINAEVNIRVGTQYLRRLMTQFNGNVVLALAAYNAGPNAASRWMQGAPPKRGMLEFIETIPYRETREYVSSIIRNYYWYSKHLNGDAPKNIAYFWNMYGPPEKLPTGLASAQKPGNPSPQPASMSPGMPAALVPTLPDENGDHSPPGAPASAPGPAVDIGPRVGGPSGAGE